jgi:hypothetical protein
MTESGVLWNFRQVRRKIRHEYGACADNRSSTPLGRGECNSKCHILNMKLLSANQQSACHKRLTKRLQSCADIRLSLVYCRVYLSARDFAKMAPSYFHIHPIREQCDRNFRD